MSICTGIPKGKEEDRLYEPIGIKPNKSFTGALKTLVDIEEEKFAKGEITKIDYEELRNKAKEMNGTQK